MRLISAPDAVVDRRERAVWFTGGFDLAWAGAPVVIVAAGYARGPVAGWIGPAPLALGVQCGFIARAFGRAAVGAEFGRLLPAGAEAGPMGRGSPAGAVTMGALEREPLPEAAVGGPF
jgi:hypothetical protein